jgi:hypothetical protein
MSDSPQDTWVFVCPDGVEYQIGDTIPMHRAAEGLIFGEEVVRLPCPGFEGISFKDTYTDSVIELPPIEPDEGCFFVGPESQAWRWEYARREIMKSRAFKIYENAMLQKSLEGLD